MVKASTDLPAGNYRLECHIFVVALRVNDEGKIFWGAPVIRRFIGQPISNLIHWLEINGQNPRIQLI